MKANSAAESEAAKGERGYGWVIGFAIALWVVFLLTVPLAYLLFWWRPLYYEGFTTERAMRKAFDFFVALAITLALLLALTIATATVAIKNAAAKYKCLEAYPRAWSCPRGSRASSSWRSC
jgi:sterol desaturase/sphingolipid hydroxylase (fatty acid hydroxylase superfamily)